MYTLKSGPSAQSTLEDERIWGEVLSIARSYVGGAGPQGAAGGTLMRELGGGAERAYVRCESIGPGSGPVAVVVAIEVREEPYPSVSELRKRWRLTPREAEVALLVAQRRSTAEIAEKLFVTRHTVRRHIEKVLMKLGVCRRTEVQEVLVRMRREAPARQPGTHGAERGWRHDRLSGSGYGEAVAGRAVLAARTA